MPDRLNRNPATSLDRDFDNPGFGLNPWRQIQADPETVCDVCGTEDIRGNYWQRETDEAIETRCDGCRLDPVDRLVAGIVAMSTEEKGMA